MTDIERAEEIIAELKAQIEKMKSITEGLINI